MRGDYWMCLAARHGRSGQDGKGEGAGTSGEVNRYNSVAPTDMETELKERLLLDGLVDLYHLQITMDPHDEDHHTVRLG